MSRFFELPESVRDYMLNPGVQTAVNHLLEQVADDFPLDLQWNEVEQYHDALLMAYKVRRDYFVALMEIWGLIWGKALEVRGVRQPLPFADLDPDLLPSPKVVWNDALYRVFDLSQRSHLRLYTALAIAPKDGVVAYVALTDSGKDMVEKKLADAEKWQRDESGYWRTSEGLSAISDDGQVDLSDLAAAVGEAAALIIQ